MWFGHRSPKYVCGRPPIILLAVVLAGCALASCASQGTSNGSGGRGGSGVGGSSGGAIGSGGRPPGTGGSDPATGGSGSGGLATGGAVGGNGGGAGSGIAGAGGLGAGGATGGRGGSAATGGGGGATGGGTAGAAGRGMGGNGGSGGTAGSGACPATLVGWGSVTGDGVSTTTGGGTTAPVRPTSAAELMMYASDSTPRVIEVAGTFNVPRLAIASNKTLIGVGTTATINGGLRIRGSSSAAVQNVIVRNLRVNGLTTDVDGDAVQIYFAHHVWIDHCDVWDGPDGNLDLTHAVNWVTVSWTMFRYTTAYQRPAGEDGDHRFANLVGHSDDNDGEDTGRLKITFHHNWWGERVLERMPRVRFGQVHVFNNYFSSSGNNYCVRAGRGAQLLVEGNSFDGVKDPHVFNSDEDEATAHITARNNDYLGTTGERAMNGGGTAFTSAPYTHTVEPASGIPALVRACAGPR
jgi:pectate lyase